MSRLPPSSIAARTFAVTAFALVLTTYANSARADGTNAASDRARAQQLFESALADVEAGKYALACPKFAASHEADPKTSTLLNLGSCYESIGRFASAWAAFREAEGLARRAGRPELERAARASAEALAPKLVRLTVNVPEASRAPGISVSRDGSKLDPAEWGIGIPVDDGDHEIAVDAPGRSPWRERVTVRGANRSVDVPRLAIAPTVPTATPRVPNVSTSVWWTPARSTGVAMAGVGVASIATGLVLAFVAKSNYDDARAQCRADDDCPPNAVRDAESARSLATGGTVAIIAGTTVAAIGGGLVLLSRSARHEAQAALVVAGPSSLGVVGRW